MTNGLSPEALSKWAKRIASEVDPEYEPLAPMMLEAYLRGGRERKQLFDSAPTVGAILPDGGTSLLPFAFLALSWIATNLSKLYRSGGISALSDLFSLWKSWLELAKTRKTMNAEPSVPEVQHEALFSLRRILDEVQQVLEKQGLPTEQCELVSYRVMKALLNEPNEAAAFVKALQNGN